MGWEEELQSSGRGGSSEAKVIRLFIPVHRDCVPFRSMCVSFGLIWDLACPFLTPEEEGDTDI